MSDDLEREKLKKAIFDGMSKKAQERILRTGFERWDPFPEPKDPRERIFGSAALQANAMVDLFFATHHLNVESVVVRKELFELCRGLLAEEERAKVIFEFCNWYEAQMKKAGPG